MHGVGAAQCHPASELRAGHAEHVAQHPQEWGVTVNIDVVGGSVDFDGVGHGFLNGGWVLSQQGPEVSWLRVILVAGWFRDATQRSASLNPWCDRRRPRRPGAEGPPGRPEVLPSCGAAD